MDTLGRRLVWGVLFIIALQLPKIVVTLLLMGLVYWLVSQFGKSMSAHRIQQVEE